MTEKATDLIKTLTATMAWLNDKSNPAYGYVVVEFSKFCHEDYAQFETCLIEVEEKWLKGSHATMNRFRAYTSIEDKLNELFSVIAELNTLEDSLTAEQKAEIFKAF